MIPIPHDASPQDVDQWCNRGVVMVNVDGAISPAMYVSNLGRQGLEVELLVEGRTVVVPRQSIYVHWPRCGSVNIPESPYAVHAARLTQRQYRRTWHVAGLKVVTPRTWDIAKYLGVPAQSLTVPIRALARACFSPEYPSVEEAERKIQDGSAITVAVSPSLILAGDSSGKRMFYFNGTLSATASDGALHMIGDEVAMRRILKFFDGRYYVYPNI